MKKPLSFTFLALGIWLSPMAKAQDCSISLDTCYAMAKRNYPLVQQYALIEKSAEYSIENANRANFTRINVAGQASYQSEVTALPITIPGMSIDPLSKDQYKLYGELNQPITSLVTINNQRNLIEANAAIEEKKIEVELYKIKERINNLFFGVLLIDAQIEQVQFLIKDLQNGIDKINTAIANGVALPSAAQNLQAEKLRAEQRIIELRSNKNAFLAMLSQFIGKSISAETIFEKPNVLVISENISRPELALFDLEKKSFEIQSNLITNKTLPQVNLFLQSGIGRPALNMLNNDFRGYYIGGLRVNWNISNYYTSNTEKKLLAVNQSIIQVQKDVFLFNTHLAMEQQNAEVQKMEELIESDNKIIILRESIKNTTKVQLENGTATSNDYLVAVNAQDQAQQNLLLHQIQLLSTLYTLQSTTGN